MRSDKAIGTHHLIVGNSTAAIGGIEGIRAVDRNMPILVVSKETDHAYSRPLISYLLAGEIGEEMMRYRPESFYEEHGVELRPGVKAVSIDTAARRVCCADGGRIGFETLLVATGGIPVIPPIDGVEGPGVFTFASWDDCRAIAAFLEDRNGGGARTAAVVVGGGLIGIKAAEALRARGAGVTVVERERRLLPLMLEEVGGEMAREAAARAGVDAACGVSVDRIRRNGGVSGVTLSDGREVECDMVVIAVGVRPAIDIVEGTAIETDAGILVDERCRTSLEGVYAAGDVAQTRNANGRPSGVLGTFPSAYRQGMVAGMNMAGGDAALAAEFAMNSVQVFGLPVISVGEATASGRGMEEITTNNGGGARYRRVMVRGGRVTGALFVGDIDRAGIVTGLMRERIDVSAMKESLVTDDLGMVSLPQEYRKHVVRGEGIEV